MGQTVNKIKVNRGEPEFANPAEHLFGHLARLNAMDGFLHFRLEILHPERSAVEANLAEGSNMVTAKPPRIDLDPGFDVLRKSKMPMDAFAELSDFIRGEEGR